MRRPPTVFETFWNDLTRSDPEMYVGVEVHAMPAKHDPFKELDIIAKDASRPLAHDNGYALTPILNYLSSHDAQNVSAPKKRSVHSSLKAKDVMDLALQPYVALIIRDTT
ncbi:TPA: hypothetical protein HA251_00650 [Candidatus Woesearchaeota archaeon]|nr:hypothetical protein [Candidatus Woesearchaeota archaeon]